MKIRTILFGLVMTTVLLVSACQPVETPSGPYPVEQPTEPATAEPGAQPYPIAEPTTEPTEGKIVEPILNQTDEAKQKLAMAQNAFMMKLYAQLASGDENLIVSPYSLYQALLMAYLGADDETAHQMEKALGLPLEDELNHLAMRALNEQLTQPGEEEGAFMFNSANALWAQDGYSFHEEYLAEMEMFYQSGLYAVDFAKSEEARQQINDWVAEKTKNKILDLIPSGVLSEATRLVLTNAAYFKAAWAKQFGEALTTSEKFYTLGGAAKPVEMMHVESNFSYYQSEQATAIELPYAGGKFSMVALMPKDGTFSDYQTDLSGKKLSEIIAGLNHGKVNLSFPKFKIESALGLTQALQSLGIKDAFDPKLADFSEMSKEKGLVITDVLQKAMIDVDEKGTEAAAATAVVVGVTSAPAQEDPTVITFDHPFMFFIRDVETNTVLFMGRVTNP